MASTPNGSVEPSLVKSLEPEMGGVVVERQRVMVEISLSACHTGHQSGACGEGPKVKRVAA